MLRPAVSADLPRLLAIRDGSGADALSNPALVTETELARLIAAGTVSVWDEDGHAAGFAAVDVAVDPGAIHLLVDTAARGKGAGRELLAAACDRIRKAGHDAAILRLAPGNTAARHYRAAGWIEAAPSATGEIALKKPL